MPVFAVGERAICKLFAAPFRRWFDTERWCLERVAGRLGVPTPELIAVEEVDGWGVVLMTRVEGVPIDRVVSSLPRQRQLAAMDRLGELVARLHAVPVEGLEIVDTAADVAARLAGAVEVQRRHGLAEHWLAQLPGFLARHAPTPPARPVLLHTELGPGHVLVDGHGEITGVIDFADALVGHPELELPAVGLFICKGDRVLFQRFLAAAGRTAQAAPLLVQTLLHRYARLPWYLREVPPGDDVITLEALAERWFG
jgi:hygromycin-B 7''-O-kinase